jgi:hypothetical protein
MKTHLFINWVFLQHLSLQSDRFKSDDVETRLDMSQLALTSHVQVCSYDVALEFP